jgi:hypothetical protein
VDRVWERLQHAATWAGIGPIDSVWDATVDRGRLASFRWAAIAAGRSWEGGARTIRAVPGELMELALSSPEIQGSITCALAATGQTSCTATITLEAEASGLLASLFWGTVDGAIRSNFAGHVEAFAKSVG